MVYVDGLMPCHISGHPALDRKMANILQDFWFSGTRTEKICYT